VSAKQQYSFAIVAVFLLAGLFLLFTNVLPGVGLVLLGFAVLAALAGYGEVQR
jgi:hypothetical protein